jgi:glycosyltransferase involved in cell wall biosynthesis
MNKSVQKRIKNSNVHIFPHCLPRDLIYERKYKKNKNLQLISISELTENKRTIDVIKAVEILRDRGIIVSLKILGDGQKFNSLKNYISRKQLNNQIQLVGYTKNIKHYLLNSDIFVQASLNEGLSLSLIESIGMGLVPVVTEAGSEKDILSNNTNGLFIKKKNPNDLADKLQFLSSENNFEHFFNAVKELKINLDIKNATKKVDQILSNL